MNIGMKTYASAALAILLAASCAKEEAVSPVPGADGQKQPEITMTDCSVVLFDDRTVSLLEEAAAGGKIMTKSMDLNNIIDELGVVSYERVFPDAGPYEGRTRREGLHKWYMVKYSDAVQVTKAEKALNSLPGVVTVERPRKIRRLTLPDDPNFKWQWNMYNDKSLNLTIRSGARILSSNEGCDINVKDIWEAYTTGNPSVIVSVVDEGIDLEHEDLKANCIPAGENGSRNFATDNEKNFYKVTPGDHGTHVGGVISAIRNNGIGVAGIAGGDYAAGKGGVRLMSCQIFEDPNENLGNSYYNSEAYAYSTANAIKWGADHGAVISQNSWGYDYDRDSDGELTPQGRKEALADKISSVDKAAVDYFIKYAGCDDNGQQLPDSPMKGGVVIFAAGNDQISNGAPANYEPIIAVGAIGPDWLPTWYTNYGDWVDICAPGGDNYGAGWGSENDGIYSRGSILSTLSPTMNIDDLYPGKSYGYMGGTSMACPHVSGVAALVLSLFGGPDFTNKDLEDALVKGANKDYISERYPTGPALDAAGAFEQAGAAIDYKDDIAPDNIDDFTVTPDRKTVTFSFNTPADEDDGKALGVLCILGTDKAMVENCNPASPDAGLITSRMAVSTLPVGSPVNMKIQGLAYATQYYAAVYAYDSHMKYSESSPVKPVATPENRAPQQTAPFEDRIMWDKNSSFSEILSGYMADPDEDPITFSFKMENTSMTFVSINNETTEMLVRALDYGLSSITITATDEDGKSGSFSFRVLIKNSADPIETIPAAVTSTLTIRTAEPAETHVRILSSSGKTVYEQTQTFSGFEPLEIDMKDCAPGRYSLTVRLNGKEHKKVITKI